MIRVLLLAALSLGACTAMAQAPNSDGPFRTTSNDEDSNLIFVRELYDPEKRIQSIYLRVHDGSPDYDVTSGELFFSGAEMVRVISSRDALKESDLVWGIPGVNYGRNRGLDGPDPSVQIPVEDTELDLALIQENSFRFWFGTGQDIDDLRLLIRYPEENQTANVDVVLYHRRGPDSEGYPPSGDGGIVIGSIEDVMPDDGLYNNDVFSVQNVKLRTEDFDVVESEVDLGIVDYRGGSIGPGLITIENFFNENDVDGDNGRDQNGDIVPIHTSGPVDNLRVRVLPLIGPALASIPASGVQVLGIPRHVDDGQQAVGRVSVDVPVDTPEGEYSGRVTIWEDNNLNGLIEETEPSDSVLVIVTVQDRQDAGPIEPEDAFLDDATVDAGIPVDIDAEPIELDVNVPDMDLPAEDALVVTDVNVMDLAVVPDAERPQTRDADVVVDAQQADADTPTVDAASMSDMQTSDVALAMDSVVAPMDMGESQPEWPGLPRGGALGCQLQTFGGHGLILLALVLMLRRRR